MKHAIRRLEEEARELAAGLADIERDPTGSAGGFSAARMLRDEIAREIADVKRALGVLRAAAPSASPNDARIKTPPPETRRPKRRVSSDWDKEVFEPWSERKARLAAERERA